MGRWTRIEFDPKKASINSIKKRNGGQGGRHGQGDGMRQPGGKKLEITIVDSMNEWGMMGVAGKWL